MANNTFQIRRTATSGRTPNTTNSANNQYINIGELALNLTDSILYSANATNGLITIGSNLTATSIGGGALIANSSQITITGIPLSANGSVGTQGQVLTSNGSVGSPYWTAIAATTSNTVVYEDTFTGNGSNTQYTLSGNTTQDAVLATINGLLQPNNTYAVVGTNNIITFSESPASLDTIVVKRLGGAGGPATYTGGNGNSYITISNTELRATSNNLTLTIGAFASNGDLTAKQYLLYGTTTGNTETELLIRGSERVLVNANTTVYYTADIVARRTDAINEGAGFHLKGVADNFSGTVADVGLLYEVIVARDDIALSVDARANTTTDSINIYVTGKAAKTIRWVAQVTTVEVSQ